MKSIIVAVVTGANRGIGEAICRSLNTIDNLNEKVILYATSRKGVDLGISTSPNKMQVRYPKLDIRDSTSIKTLAENIKNEHDGVDVLINNAGIYLDNEYSPQSVKETLDINYRANLQMCQIFIPIMKQAGRIVNISSAASSLRLYSNEIKTRLRETNLTLQELDKLVSDYQGAIETAGVNSTDITTIYTGGLLEDLLNRHIPALISSNLRC